MSTVHDDASGAAGTVATAAHVRRDSASSATSEEKSPTQSTPKKNVDTEEKTSEGKPTFELGGRAVAKIVKPDTFEAENHWYAKVQNAQVATQVSFFLGMNNDVLICRYCHLHPTVDAQRLKEILNYEPRYFSWSGADLFNVTNHGGDKKMLLIETNSCPSGQKSMPVLDNHEEHGSYRLLIERTFKPMVEDAERRGDIPREGRLAVIWDKNRMETSGYAHTIADVFKEEVLFVEYYHNDTNPCVRFTEDHLMEVLDAEGKWHPVRAAFRYVTQKPWNRIPINTRTLILNPTIACLAGGRNKLVAAKAYELFNAEILQSGLKINVPRTVRDVERNLIPLYVHSFGGFAVVKNPYSNAGQGVWTITNEQELEDFMQETADNKQYDQYIVQSLIGNSKWSSQQGGGASGIQYYHVGSVPNNRKEIYVSDLRMMVHFDYTRKAFAPIALYARRALIPLADDPSGKKSWDMLGTNLSYKRPDGTWDTDTKRLICMDRKEFNKLGLGLDDLVDAYIQTVMATVAIDKMARLIAPNPQDFDINMFSSLNSDPTLLREIAK